MVMVIGKRIWGAKALRFTALAAFTLGLAGLSGIYGCAGTDKEAAVTTAAGGGQAICYDAPASSPDVKMGPKPGAHPGIREERERADRGSLPGADGRRPEADAYMDACEETYMLPSQAPAERFGPQPHNSQVAVPEPGPAPGPPPGPPTGPAGKQRKVKAGRDSAAPQLGKSAGVAASRIGCEPAPRAKRYFGADEFEHVEVNPVKLTSEERVSTFSIDVDTASYAFVRRSLNSGHLPEKDAVRVEEMINYFDYDYELPADRKRPFRASVAVYPTPWNPGTKLMHIGIKGHDIAPENKPRANLVFLIDVSGSMSSYDKLPLLIKSMKMLVDTLGPEDTVGIVVYAGAAGTVLEPTKAADKRRIIAALDRLRSGGSTAGAEGIRQAYLLAESAYDEGAVNRVILATDGDFNVGITDREELKGFIERKRETGIYLSVLGFGMGNYNDALMQKLAQNGNGNAAYIDTLSEARKVLVDEASSTLIPIAKDVKIQVEFNPARVAEYRLIGYETRMLRREDFNNDRIDAGDIGCGHTVTAIYEITPADSGARMVDELRYVRDRRETSFDYVGDEYAFLKIRYKLPREKKSRLISEPIGPEREYESPADVPSEMRFAAAVAGFGQLLRGAPYTNGFGYDDVIELARTARGEDCFGYRSEFLGLVRLAKSSADMPEMPVYR